jgi:hypothetical protein
VVALATGTRAKNKDRDLSRSSGTKPLQLVSRYFGGVVLGDLGGMEPGVRVAGVLVPVPKPLLPAGREVAPLAFGGAATPDCTL